MDKRTRRRGGGREVWGKSWGGRGGTGKSLQSPRPKGGSPSHSPSRSPPLCIWICGWRRPATAPAAPRWRSQCLFWLLLWYIGNRRRGPASLGREDRELYKPWRKAPKTPPGIPRKPSRDSPARGRWRQPHVVVPSPVAFPERIGRRMAQAAPDGACDLSGRDPRSRSSFPSLGPSSAPSRQDLKEKRGGGLFKELSINVGLVEANLNNSTWDDQKWGEDLGGYQHK